MRIYQPTITGSLNVSGSVTAESFTGSLFGSSSYALTASYALNGGGGGSGAGFPYSGSAVITGSLLVSGSGLIITGSTISTEGFTGSLFGTASFAISSSYSVTSSYSQTAQSTVSASYAATSSYSTTFTAATSLIIDGAIQKGVSMTYGSPSNPSLFDDPTGSYTSAFGRYTLSNGANSRAGEFMTSWNGGTTTYTDVSTTDIGDTSGVIFSSQIVTGNIQIKVIIPSSGWTVKMLVMYL